jgi:hypothetical protein
MKSVFTTLSLIAVLSLATFAHAAKLESNDTKLTKKQLSALIASARTPAEHERIAAYYNAKAQDLLAESAMHQKMSEQFKANPVTNSAKQQIGTVNHCQYIATSLRNRAVQLQGLALEHEKMAEQAQK